MAYYTKTLALIVFGLLLISGDKQLLCFFWLIVIYMYKIGASASKTGQVGLTVAGTDPFGLSSLGGFGLNGLGGFNSLGGFGGLGGLGGLGLTGLGGIVCDPFLGLGGFGGGIGGLGGLGGFIDPYALGGFGGGIGFADRYALGGFVDPYALGGLGFGGGFFGPTSFSSVYSNQQAASNEFAATQIFKDNLAKLQALQAKGDSNKPN